LVALNDPGKPLRSKLLAVPALKAKYLAHVKTIAQDSLDWNKLGPIVAGYQALIEKELEADTRKLSSIAEFRQAVSAGESVEGGREARSNLRKFATSAVSSCSNIRRSRASTAQTLLRQTPPLLLPRRRSDLAVKSSASSVC